MGTISEKLVYLNGTKQAIKQAINEDFEVIDNNTTFREYADEISSNNAKYKDLIPKETKNATNTLDISNSSCLDKALVTLYGNTYQEGEPTPDYPQDIQVVSGDNTIKVDGKNLFDISTITENTYIDDTGNTGSSRVSNLSDYIELKPNASYTLSYDYSTLLNSAPRDFVYYDENKTIISGITYSPINKTSTFTTPNNAKYLRFSYDKNSTNIQIESGSTATEYEPYKGQTYPISLDYTNLFKKQDISSDDLNKRLNQIGENYNENGYFISPFIKVDKDTQYTINYTPTAYTRICYFVSNNTNSFISKNDDTSSFTTPSTCQYLRFCNLIADIDNIRLEKGSTITNNYIELCKIGDYKDRIYPLNGKWYLEKKIGKVVLDGTQNIPLASGTPRRFNATYTALGMDNVKSGTTAADTQSNYRMCDHFGYTRGQTTWGNYYLHNNWLVLLDNESVMASANDLKNWLANNPTTIYYVLATPTTEEITESNYPTLYNQLNNIKLFEGVNHITMTNESGLDVEFDITYYKDWKLD